MNETVYIETSIIGYLTARTSNNLILMANVEATREWWDVRRDQFELYISQTVLDEAARGDTEIARRRLEILNNFPLLEVNEAVQDLAVQFLTKSNLPPKAADDAIHIAIARDEQGKVYVEKSENYPDRKQEWVNMLDHNYLRITRMLKCLITFGLIQEAQAFYECLKKIYREDSDQIGGETFQYWTDAVNSV